MIVIACVDNNMGMMFNNRRQSQDRVLRDYLMDLMGNSILWMNEYSASQFITDYSDRINVDNNFLINIGNSECCFTENVDVIPYEHLIEKIILFKWNRDYPADFRFSIDLSKWTLAQTDDFAGSSHEKITMEVYVQ